MLAKRPFLVFSVFLATCSGRVLVGGRAGEGDGDGGSSDGSSSGGSGSSGPGGSSSSGSSSGSLPQDGVPGEDGGHDGPSGEPLVVDGGPCTQNSQCGAGAFCNQNFRCGAAPGVCQPTPACSAFAMRVCPCDGSPPDPMGHYSLDCANGWGISVAYAGPCRSGAVVLCDSTHPCPATQVCAVDPRSACDGGTCPGVCLTTLVSTQATAAFDTRTTTCVNLLYPGQCDRFADANPRTDCSCVFTAGITCSDSTQCPAGQICMPSVGTAGSTYYCDGGLCAGPPYACVGGGCPSYCVVP